ncbi:MucR family transcriptional regulator [Novosphingobium sp. PhB165]|uniref:MucR family transcriptional regulator n=1 Tax=Novosphingobium sp. PhB165 TaxID=2485105 RepID=UPI00105284C6|nr:MucR family transcriptional regulator [Novosphingobium sp. PhB165]TCM20583.1 MucR family transcriptional regulator [Novosphingobium sp. PhB165]
MSDNAQPELARLTVELLSAYFTNNSVPSSDLPGLIEATRTALSGSATPEPEAAPDFTPAVSVEESLASRDHIISLLDGKPYRTLKRHLSNNGLTPEQYKDRYKLPADYPMVAATYSEQRRSLAKKLGLGSRSPQVAPPSSAAKPSAKAPKAAAATPKIAAAKAVTAKAAEKPAPKTPKAPAKKVTAKVASAGKPKLTAAKAASTPAASGSPASEPTVRKTADAGAKKERRMARPKITAESGAQTSSPASDAKAKSPTKPAAKATTTTAAKPVKAPAAATKSAAKPKAADAKKAKSTPAKASAPKAAKKTAPKIAAEIAVPAANPEPAAASDDKPAVANT